MGYIHSNSTGIKLPLNSAARVPLFFSHCPLTFRSALWYSRLTSTWLFPLGSPVWLLLCVFWFWYLDPISVFPIILILMFNNVWVAPFKPRVYEDNRTCLTLQALLSYVIIPALLSKLVHCAGIPLLLFVNRVDPATNYVCWFPLCDALADNKFCWWPVGHRGNEDNWTCRTLWAPTSYITIPALYHLSCSILPLCFLW